MDEGERMKGEREPMRWTVTVQQVAGWRWKWTVVAPRYHRAVAWGETFTKRGATRNAERWIRDEVQRRDSVFTWEVET